MIRLAAAAVVRTLWKCRAGQDLIEYALMAGFLGVLVGASVPSAVGAVTNAFTTIVADLNVVAASVTSS